MAKELSVISKIYEAILRPEIWPETLSLFATKANAKSSVLLVTEDEQLNYECIAASPDWSRRQLFEYSKNFFATEIEIFRLLSQQHTRNFILDRQLHSTEQNYWDKPINDWMRDSLGVQHRSGAGLHVHNAWVGVITLQYDADRKNIDDNELSSLNKYVRHFSRAVEVSRTLTTLKNRFGASLAALDNLEQAVIVLNNRAEVMVKNSVANEILSNADGLSLTPKNQLRAADPQSKKNLDWMITMILSISDETVAHKGDPITIKRTNLKPSYILDATPIVDSIEKFDGHSEGAIIFIVDPTAPCKINVNGLAQLYGLTTTEEIITQLLVSGKSIGDISDIRNTSIQTVRTQVKSILQKTNSNTQSNLVRLAYLLNPPIIA